MWYFIVCIGTPLNAQCVAPQIVQSEEVCRVLDERYRGAAQAVNDKALTFSHCVQVPQSTPRRATPDLNVPMPDIRLP